tara:strand:- start:374 stop:778 length:405 start_codon:yes stop_codon:yes gene_type:complete
MHVYKTAKHNIIDVYTGLRMLRTFKKRTGVTKTYTPCIVEEQKNIIYHAHTFHTLATLVFLRFLLGKNKIKYIDIRGPPSSTPSSKGMTSIGIKKLLTEVENGNVVPSHYHEVTNTMNFNVPTVSGKETEYFTD